MSATKSNDERKNMEEWRAARKTQREETKQSTAAMATGRTMYRDCAVWLEN